MTDVLNEQPDFTRTRWIQWDSSWPESAGGDERNRLFSYLEGRFGIPEVFFDDYLLFEKGRAWWILRDSPLVAQACMLKIWRVGLKAFQEVGDFVKPTTRMIQAFGYLATRGILDIDEGDLQRLAAGEHLPVDMHLENGYVILSLKGCILGLGLLINGTMRSQIPRKDINPVIT